MKHTHTIFTASLGALLGLYLVSAFADVPESKCEYGLTPCTLECIDRSSNPTSCQTGTDEEGNPIYGEMLGVEWIGYPMYLCTEEGTAPGFTCIEPTMYQCAECRYWASSTTCQGAWNCAGSSMMKGCSSTQQSSN